ncbi:MAG: SRPBCC family protein [Cyanobacteria bacterium P01_C01_bin.72]
MNSRPKIERIWLIFSLIIFSGINLNLYLSSTVLAQNPPQSIELSIDEKSDLQRGKVVLKGEKGKYLGQVIATGDITAAWEVLTDYDNFEQFLPNISASKIIESVENRVVFEQVNLVDLWLFQQEFIVQIEALKSKPNKVDFKIVDGELKKLVGRWQIEETSPGKILISHAVEVEPGSDTEKPFFYGVYESSLEETLKAIATEITRRSQL